MEVPFFKIV
jgi:hypothetical protein